MLSVQSLTKVFGDDAAAAGGVRQASFNVEKGAFFTLLGPSGCGKTSTPRCVAGLEQPGEGIIAIGTTVLDGSRDLFVPVHRRNIGMVLQSTLSFPVAGTIALTS